MKSGDHIIGVDIGTSSLKAALFDANMKQVSFHQVEYPLIHKDNGHIEQISERWYSALCEATRTVIKNIEVSRVAALALSTQGGTLVCLDNRYRPVMNAISWMDNRTVETEQLLPDGMSTDDVRRVTGWNVNNYSIFSKLQWHNRDNPETLNRVSYIADCCSYMNHKLCGQFAVDHTNAAITQLQDIDKKDWSAPFLSHVRIQRERLPALVPSGTSLGRLTPQASSDLGLPANTEVVSGGHDQYCAALGAGVTQSGNCLLSGGTAWVILAIIENPDRKVRTCGEFACGLHVVDSMHGILSSIPRAGAAVTWFSETFSSNAVDESERSDFLAPVPGADGLRFTFDPSGRMSFKNIDFHHRPHHFLQAIKEGIAVHLNKIIADWERCGVPVDKFVMTGGAARSSVWPQIVANVTNRVVGLPSYSEFACRGAALLAGMGNGLFDDASLLDAVALNFPNGVDIQPNPDAVKLY